MSNTNRRRKDDRRAELHRFAYWLETEYEVAIEWSYTPRGMLGEQARALATATATWLSTDRLQEVKWVVSGEVIVDAKGIRELQAHMEILSRLMQDMQMARMYGTEECEYLVISPDGE